MQTVTVKARVTPAEAAQLEEALALRETTSEFLRSAIRRELQARAAAASERNAAPAGRLADVLRSLDALNSG